MKPVHLLGVFGIAAAGAGILTGSLLLFEKAIGRAGSASNLTLTIVMITLLSNPVCGICVGNIVTHLS